MTQLTPIFEGPPSKTRPKLQSKQVAPFVFQEATATPLLLLGFFGTIESFLKTEKVYDLTIAMVPAEGGDTANPKPKKRMGLLGKNGTVGNLKFTPLERRFLGLFLSLDLLFFLGDFYSD